jgi:O-antigen ligase
MIGCHASVLAYLQLIALVLAPWWYGGTPDCARFGLVTLLLLSTGAWLWSRHVDRGTAAAIGSLLAWGLLQAAAVSRSPVSTLESVFVLAASLAAILFWSHEGRDETRARALACSVPLVCLGQAMFGVVQAQTAPYTLYGHDDPAVRAPFGSFHNHNHFAGLMEMGALLALAMAFGRAKRKEGVDPLSIGFAGLSLALAGAHLASRSRGGLLALIVGGAALVALWWLALATRALRRRDWAIGTLMLAALLGFGWFAVPSSTRSHLATAFRGPTDASGGYRIAIAGATLRLWWEHPLLGCGLGNYADEVTRFKRSDGLVRAGHAESDAFELLAEGGIVGLALFAWLTVAIVRGFLDRLREGRDPWRKSLAVGAMSAVIAILAHSFFDFNLRIPSNALVFSVLLGLAGAPRSDPATQAPRWARLLLAAAFAVLAVAAAWRAVGAVELRHALAVSLPDEQIARLSSTLSRHPYLAEAWQARAHAYWRVARGSREVNAYRLQAATEDVQRALRLRPHRAYGWADLGWLHHMQADNTAAGRAFDRAVELDPASVDIALARADFFARTGRLNEARQELRRCRGYNLDWREAVAESAARRMGLGSLK